MDADEVLAAQAAVDEIVRALASPIRRYLLELLRHDGADATELALSAVAQFGISRSRASSHLRHLERAGLVEVDDWHPWRHYRIRDEAAAPLIRWLGGLGKP